MWDAGGRGVKPRWQEADLEYLERCLEQEPRTYNALQLAEKLEQERCIDLSADWIGRLLKKRGSVGKELDTLTVTSKTRKKYDENLPI